MLWTYKVGRQFLHIYYTRTKKNRVNWASAFVTAVSRQTVLISFQKRDDSRKWKSKPAARRARDNTRNKRARRRQTRRYETLLKSLSTTILEKYFSPSSSLWLYSYKLFNCNVCRRCCCLCLLEVGWLVSPCGIIVQLWAHWPLENPRASVIFTRSA